MNATAVLFLVLTAISAVVHWWSVATSRRSVLLVTKPLTMISLIALAVTIDTTDGSTRAWFIVALALSLAGDVFLMLEPDQFIAGLASFLMAHVAYVIGLTLAGFALAPSLLAVAGAAIAFVAIGRRILTGAGSQDAPLTVPVALYMAVISAMVITAVATANLMATAGAVLFYASDAALGWNRFVSPITDGRLITMITYHAGQTLLILSLATL